MGSAAGALMARTPEFARFDDSPTQPRGRGFEPTVLRERPIAPAPLLEPVPELPLANRLVAVAIELLLMLPQLRQASQHPDPVGLQNDLLARLRRFEAEALRRGAEASDVGPARYILCAALDEAVLTTPWGAESIWLQRSLLSQLHQETWGGEKVFTILEQVRRDPDRHLELIELADICLSLGFQGRFRLLDNGLTQLEELRESLARSIAGRRPERPAALAPAWTPSVASGRIRGWLPLWVVALVAVAAALIAYTIFLSQVSSEIDQVAGTIRQIDAGR